MRKKKKSNLKKGWLIAGLSLTGALSIGCFTASMVKLVNDSRQQEDTEYDEEKLARYEGEVMINRVLQRTLYYSPSKYDYCEKLANKAKKYMYDYSISSQKSVGISALASNLVMMYVSNNITQLPTLQTIFNGILDDYISLITTHKSISDNKADYLCLIEYRGVSGYLEKDEDITTYTNVIQPLIAKVRKLIIDNDDMYARGLTISNMGLVQGVWASIKRELNREEKIINFVDDIVYKNTLRCKYVNSPDLIAEVAIRTCERLSSPQTDESSLDKIINLAKIEIEKYAKL